MHVQNLILNFVIRIVMLTIGLKLASWAFGNDNYALAWFFLVGMCVGYALAKVEQP